MEMPSAEVLTVIGIVSAVLVGSLAIWGTRRWGTRRRRLLFECNSTSLIPPSEDTQRLLKVTYRDLEVAEPNLVTVRLRNVGPADIASIHFDAGKPLTIRLNAIMYGLTGGAYPTHNTVSTAVGARGEIGVGPQLLRRNEEWVFEAVVSGEARPELESPLVDTDIVDVETYYMRQGYKDAFWLAWRRAWGSITLPR